MDKEKIKNILTKEIPENQILIDEPMKNHTSFKIGGAADLFVRVSKIEELYHVLEVINKEKIHLTIIGNGSNILVKDNGIYGIVLKIDFNKLEIEKKEETAIVTVGAGVRLGELAQKLLKEEIAGLEFASGIPGTIGGAVRMNAGAYGTEMKDIVLETKVLSLDDYEKNNIIILTNSEQQFSYRHSIFMNKRYIVLETKLKLKMGKYEEIKSKMDEYTLARKEKQPVNMPSAGSIFKRGEDFITAKLIDECGLKGYKIGGAKVSEIHAGFIVNEGNATAKDVLDLVKYVQNVVYEKTGKKIELEIEILGD